MEYRRLGRTGLTVSAMGLGTWQFGGEWGRRFSPADVDQILGRARDLGINLVDTAECYGDHLAESLIGSAIASQRGDWIVATKFGHRFHQDRMTGGPWTPGTVRSDHWSPAEVVEQLEDSLRALQTDHIDIYLFHSGADEVFDQDDLWATLDGQVAKGKLRHVGIALADSDNLHQASRAAEVGASVVELTYNRINRAAERGVFASCLEQDLGVLAREPLANGYLTDTYRPGLPIAGNDDWRAGASQQQMQERLDTVEQIRRTEVPAGVPTATWALAWCLKNPAVDSVITGTRSIGQLEMSANAIERAASAASPPPTVRKPEGQDPGSSP
jgi:aryl-alcohol dehydrogenase-like predicted oxidoreductase